MAGVAGSGIQAICRGRAGFGRGCLARVFGLGGTGGGPLNGAVREPPVLRPIDATHVEVRGRRLLAFVGSDYLRMSWHPAVRRGGEVGIRQYGTGACASRMTTGNLPIYGELETALKRYFSVGSATLTSAGYTAPMVAVQALAAEHDQVLVDAKAHGCLVDAALVSGLPTSRFEHSSAVDLERELDRLARGQRALVLVNGLDPVDGTVGPLEAFKALVGQRGTLLVDDAHGVGVLGSRGRGCLEWAGLGFGGVVVTLTLSKTFGSYGGVVLGEPELRERILTRSRIFTGNTPPAPASVSASLASVSVLQREGERLRARLRENLERFPARIRGLGAGGDPGPGPMFAVKPASDRDAERLRLRLLRAGIYPSLIRYPNGPSAQFFRFAISSAHTGEQVARLAEAIEGWLAKGGGNIV